MSHLASTSHPLNEGELPQAEIYTDGGCEPNPGLGGWSAIIRVGRCEWVLAGNDPDTTNNRMELQAAAAALVLVEGLLGRFHAHVYTDSQYLRLGVTQRLDRWVDRGWRASDNQPVKNQDLWRKLYYLTRAHDVTWSWLKGHAGHPLNERVDQLATESLRALRRELDKREARQATHDERPSVQVYVKASCHGARGPGGWGAVLRKAEHTRSLSDSASSTTANAMLIRGATEALRALTSPCRVSVYSDSNYLIKGASLWVHGWQARGWRTRDSRPVANRTEWETLLEAARPHQVTWLQAKREAIPADLALAGELAAQALEHSDQEAQ